MKYSPRRTDFQLLDVITRLCNANRSDRCIVSGEKLRELLGAWFHVQVSVRTVWYHLARLKTELYITGQTRYRIVNHKLALKARTRYRVLWRSKQRLLRCARSSLKFLALPVEAHRQQTVQKIALGLETLLRSVVPNST